MLKPFESEKRSYAIRVVAKLAVPRLTAQVSIVTQSIFCESLISSGVSPFAKAVGRIITSTMPTITVITAIAK